MGEVYRARDTKLNRDVALKILPDAFASDPDRLARFTREAHTLASLNHPNIAHIHGLEESSGVRALVMELVEGEDLSQRIVRGPIPLDEALPLATQIARALEAAHRQGIIHRDLKPANVKVRVDGTVKVLDFGLAKAMDPAGAGTPNRSKADTVTTPAMTEAGVILGTAAYMSPEQAKGTLLDERADLWAFGCVLFEMLTGVRPFSGETVTETLAAVLMREPDWSVLPDNVPPPIRILLRRCLEKNVGRRLADIAAVLVLIDELPALTAPAPLVAEAAVGAGAGFANAATRRDMVRASRRSVMLALAGGATLAVATGMIVWLALRPGSPAIVRTMVTPSGPSLLSIGGFDRDVAITPDGSRIVYRGIDQLLVRSLGSLEPTVLVAGGSLQGVFMSPDGQWVGFFEGSSTLRKVAITGGPATTLAGATAPFPRGATWGDDGTIVFGIEGHLRRVLASGGESEVFASPDRAKGEGEYFWPEFLPGSEALLFTIVSQEGPQIATIDVHTRTRKTLVRGSGARYLATGHLIYGLGANLLAVPFDPSRLEVTGAPVVVLQDIAMTAGGGVNVAVSRTGTLAYLPGGGGFAGERSLVWVDRTGREQPVSAPPRTYQMARLSPDGTRAALDIRDQDNDIWIWAFGPQTLTRLTSAPGNDMFPVWTRDSERVIFTTAPNKEGRRDLAWRAADGSTPVERLVEGQIGSYFYRPYSLANASTLLLDLNSDILTLDISSAGRQQGTGPTPLVQTPFAEQNAEVSPDGRWVAFQSNESGGDEIYVRPFPNGKGRALVSASGGRTPLWSHDGQELFYGAPDGAVMSVRVVKGPVWQQHGPATQVVRPGYFHAGEIMRTFDVAPDGSRFLMIKQNTDTTGAPRSIVLVQHWFEELKRLVPTK